MTTLKELLAQQEALEKQIAETRERELTEVIGKIRAAITEYGLTEKDLFGAADPPGKTSAPAPKSRQSIVIRQRLDLDRARSHAEMDGRQGQEEVRDQLILGIAVAAFRFAF